MTEKRIIAEKSSVADDFAHGRIYARALDR